MKAAEVSALRGHEVILYEKQSKLGGQILIAQLGAGRAEVGAVVRNAENQLKRLPVKIVLNTEATAELVLSQNPDAVIVLPDQYPRNRL
jgi:NADPH-dependent 2,4-dienoyl-CoA reductase/sulfur reductase-like enzyme